MRTNRKSTCSTLCTTVLLCTALLFLAQPGISAEKTTGQVVYIPAYSHIYHGNKETPLLLSITLSVRNTDTKGAITVEAVNYHDTQGSLIKKYLDEPLQLNPLQSERFIVPQKDNRGGSGATFIVIWKSENPVNPPVVESIMIGTQSQLGISFTSRGVAVEQ